jgi:hypothetical protein
MIQETQVTAFVIWYYAGRIYEACTESERSSSVVSSVDMSGTSRFWFR